MSDGYSGPRHFQRSARPSFSGSPRGATNSPLARAQWPWSPSTSNYGQRPTSAMSSPVPATAGNWESGSSSSLATQTWNGTPTKASLQPASSLRVQSPVQQDLGMRQWSFFAFEWIVGDVRNLSKYVASTPSTVSSLHSDDSTTSQPSGIPQFLRETPLVGDGKFKLEISRAIAAEDTTSTSSVNEQSQEEIIVITEPSPSRTTLSLSLTSLTLDMPSEEEIGTTIMVGIKSSKDLAGQRGARHEWIWEIWDDFVFRRGSEFWECTLPPLATLLENPRISATDCFTISIQLHCPIGPNFPQQPSAYYVPKDLLDGLEASLDNANTGDVRFICLERLPPSNSETPNVDDLTSSPTSTSFSPSFTARKRIIYAHSDILTRRSEYFSTLIASSFRENTLDREHGRSFHTVVVEDADFVTVYWLLKWIYCDWLLFREEDDPRAAVDGIGAGWNARWLSQGNEWEWKTFTKNGRFEDPLDREEETTAKSVTSENISVTTISSSQSKMTGLAPPAATNRTPSRSGNSGTLRSAVTQSSAPSSRRTGNSATTVKMAQGNPPSEAIVPSPTASSRSSPSQFYPLSPSQPRIHSTRQADPHAHPTSAPMAASALSMYQIAHRYRILGLQNLALEHMINTLSSRSAFPLLLATCFWEELHMMVQDYIVEQWKDVSMSEEFETCCQEVAAGEWGPEGGKTLASLFRRLQSPSAFRFATS